MCQASVKLAAHYTTSNLVMSENSLNIEPLVQQLEAVILEGLTHDLKKQLMLSLHQTKTQTRQHKLADMTLVLLDIEDCLCFGQSDPVIDEERLEALVLKLQSGADPDQPEVDFEFKPATASHTHSESGQVATIAPEARINITLCNCPSRDEAREIARGLVEERLAACVNLIANIGAIYRWNGEIHDTAECQLQIKSSPGREDQIIQYIEQHHSNEVPEIVTIPITTGNNSYFSWVHEETR
jgi:periplasmic divalent cation tolerance protein